MKNLLWLALLATCLVGACKKDSGSEEKPITPSVVTPKPPTPDYLAQYVGVYDMTDSVRIITDIVIDIYNTHIVTITYDSASKVYYINNFWDQGMRKPMTPIDSNTFCLENGLPKYKYKSGSNETYPVRAGRVVFTKINGKLIVAPISNNEMNEGGIHDKVMVHFTMEKAW